MKPHLGQPILSAGKFLEEAKAVMIMIHGRGATADSMLKLVTTLNQPDFAYLAPQAAGNTWYPYSFLAPLYQNEPGLSSGLMVIATMIEDLEAKGVPSEQIMLLGFSQGACLALEFVARHARKYGGVVGLSGGLIGPEGSPRNYDGSLEKTPIFLGCGDSDMHIPKEHVHESTAVFKKMDAEVTERLYPNMGHMISQDEIAVTQAMMRLRVF